MSSMNCGWASPQSLLQSDEIALWASLPFGVNETNSALGLNSRIA
jgi:hypothetical protein